MKPTRRAHPESGHHDEARELRRIINEQRKEIERLREALQKIKDLPPVDEIHAIAADALDGGGDDHAS